MAETRRRQKGPYTTYAKYANRTMDIHDLDAGETLHPEVEYISHYQHATMVDQVIPGFHDLKGPLPVNPGRRWEIDLYLTPGVVTSNGLFFNAYGSYCEYLQSATPEEAAALIQALTYIWDTKTYFTPLSLELDYVAFRVSELVNQPEIQQELDGLSSRAAVAAKAAAKAGAVDVLTMLAEGQESLRYLSSLLHRASAFIGGTRKRKPKSGRRQEWLDVQLELSFGLAPIISEINSLVELVQKRNDLYTKSFKSYSTEVDLEETSESFTVPCPVFWKSGVYRSFDLNIDVKALLTAKAGFTAEFTKVGLMQFNLAKAVYEKMPLSWLIDYFSNIGEVITAAAPQFGCDIHSGWIKHEVVTQVDTYALSNSWDILVGPNYCQYAPQYILPSNSIVGMYEPPQVHGGIVSWQRFPVGDNETFLPSPEVPSIPQLRTLAAFVAKQLKSFGFKQERRHVKRRYNFHLK